MYWIAFGNWNSASGIFFIRKRMYLKSLGWLTWFGWTPFVKVEKRYSTWLGYFAKETI